MVHVHVVFEDIKDIISFTQDLDFNDFVSRTMVRKAVCMSLINIGELAKALSAAFKAESFKLEVYKSFYFV